MAKPQWGLPIAQLSVLLGLQDQVSVTVTRRGETKTFDAAKTAGWVGPFYRWTGTGYSSLSSGGTFQPLAGYWMRVFVEGCAIVFPQP